MVSKHAGYVWKHHVSDECETLRLANGGISGQSTSKTPTLRPERENMVFKCAFRMVVISMCEDYISVARRKC